MYDYGLSTLEQYSLTAVKSSRTRGALLCNTEKGLFILKEFRGSEKKLSYQQKLLLHLKEQGFLVDVYLENQEGSLVSRDKDGIPYTLQYYQEGKECDPRAKSDLRKSIGHLAQLHNAMRLEPAEDYVEMPLEEVYIRHNQELRKIRKFIRKKGPVNAFEKDYFYSAEWFIEKAEEALSKLQSSSYDKLRKKALMRGCICHGEYNQHNVWLTRQGIAVTNFGHWGFDMQISDLYCFLRKIMEKHGWDVELARELLGIYHHYKNITPEEWVNLKIRFSYPEKYWKLANYYYTHNKAWISEKNIEKMRVLLAQKEQWEQFIEKCFSYYPF